MTLITMCAARKNGSLNNDELFAGNDDASTLKHVNVDDVYLSIFLICVSLFSVNHKLLHCLNLAVKNNNNNDIQTVIFYFFFSFFF